MKERDDMVKLLEERRVKDKRVLDAFRKVPRHKFVSKEYQDIAYGDHPIPIGAGQTISQPYMVASMTELLELKGTEKVLEVGAGCGYQAAILAELAKEVITIERVKELADQAQNILKPYKNVKVITGDGTKGYAKEAPFDAIIVTAGSPVVPESLKNQLKDGGRLVIPVGTRFFQTLKRITRKGSDFVEEDFFGCVFVPLLGDEGW